MSRHADRPAPRSAARSPGSGAARSIVWPIFALVIVSVVVAATVIFAVTFSGPPPRGAMGGAAPVVRLLRTGEPVSGGPRLTFERRDELTAPGAPFGADPVAARRLAAALGVPVGEVAAFTMRPQDDRDPFGRDFLLGWRKDGEWRVVQTPRPLLAPWHLKTLAAMLIAILALAVPAWALARAISRPLAQVARAAAQVRAGMDLPPLPGGGAREVRVLSDAVAAMHARLAAHAEGRTTMLAAIAHDMGTPLSRLSFRIEQLPDAARERAAADIAEMRGMIAAALAFARDERSDVTPRLELGSLLESLVDDMVDGGAPVAVAPVMIGGGPRAVIRGDSAALRRLFANLLENAIRYGGRAELNWEVADGMVEVTVDDHGPGIDPATVERLFEPFVRGDPSRNRATGGTGLGLAIVRSIAHRHGGDAVLENGPTGARARVTLPLVG
jgi:signal transduction histidine kinase